MKYTSWHFLLLLSISAIFFLITPAFAQTLSPFKKFSSREGLSENFVTAIYQDNKGMMWFGTYDGLNMYDGYKFRVYRNIPGDSSSIPPGGKPINNIFEDSAGQLWLTIGDKIGIFEPHKGKFKEVEYDSTNPRDIEWTSVFHKDFIAFSNHYQHYCINVKTLEVRQISFPEDDEESGIHIILQFPDVSRREKPKLIRGGITSFKWAASEPFQFRSDTISTEFPLIGNIRFNKVAKDSRSRVWLNFINPSTNTVSWHIYNNANQQLEENLIKDHSKPIILDILEDRDQTIWAATSEGLLRMQKTESQFEKISTTYPELGIYCDKLFIDKRGILWIGTRGKGVFQFDKNTVRFQHLTKDDGPNSLYQSTVLGIYPYNLKLLIFHSFELSLISILDPVKLEIKYFPIKELDEMKRINKFYLEESRKNSKYENQYNWRWSNRENEFINFNSTFIAGGDQHLYSIYDGDFGEIMPIARIISNIGNITIQKWQGDTLWLGTEKSGLFAWIPKQKLFFNYSYDRNKNSISNNTIRNILFDHSGNLWLGTLSGLNYFDKKKGRFTNYSENEGLANNAVYCFTFDHFGKLWLGTGKGLSCFDTTRKVFYNFYSSDGLLNTEFNRNSAYTAPDGRIFMGGMDGIDYFDPSSIDFSSPLVKPVITEVQTNHSFLSTDSTYQLHPDHNDLFFSFSINDVTKAREASYMYMLEGIQDDWVNIRNSNEVRFAALPPGNYTFKVKAANHRGIWNDDPVIYRFTILPHWYQTWQFKAAATILSFILLLFIGRIYMFTKLSKQKSILERKQAIELERIRISSDLHDDIGGGLSTIRLLSEMMKNKNENGEISKQLGKISASSRELVQKINEIIWALNVKNDNLQSLVPFIRQYTAGFLDELNILYHIDIQEPVPDYEVSGTRRRHIFLIVKEVLNNIAKHAGAGNVKVTIQTAKAFIISINDDGIGIPEQLINKPTGNGIANMRKRIAALGGELAISNHNGTTIKISIPLGVLSHESVS